MMTIEGYKSRMGPSGLHLFNRATGVNVLLDEITVPEANWSRAPAYMSVALTNACDLECSYCYAPKHASRLDPNQVVRWCVEADQHGCLGVGFGGGEPTLYPGFVSLLESMKDHTALSVSFTTHGHRLTDEILDQITDRVNFVRVSMDGVEGTYERLRGRAYSDLLGRFAALSSRVKFGINAVVNHDTIGELDAIARVAVQFGASQILLLPEVRSGACTLTIAEQGQLEQWINSNSDQLPLAISGLASESLSIPRLPTSIGAHPDRDFLHIDADGVLKKCAFDCSGVAISASPDLMAAIDKLRSTKPLVILPTRSLS
jgi:MoaA/NifB/PqqE/SkfB family radical SAM enzyme